MDIQDLREEIDKIDDELLELLAQRYEVVKKIAQVKKDQNIGIVDKKREEELVKRLKEKGDSLGLHSDLIEQIWQLLFNEAYRVQE